MAPLVAISIYLHITNKIYAIPAVAEEVGSGSDTLTNNNAVADIHQHEYFIRSSLSFIWATLSLERGFRHTALSFV